MKKMKLKRKKGRHTRKKIKNKTAVALKTSSSMKKVGKMGDN